MSILEFIAGNVFVSGVIMLCATVMTYFMVRSVTHGLSDVSATVDKIIYIGIAPVITVAGAGGFGLAVAGLNRWSTQPPGTEGLAYAGVAVLLTIASILIFSRETAQEREVPLQQGVALASR